jgi:nucleoside-diphosphate-sugar epimerase
MRVIVLGGTRFIGRASVEELVAHGHDVMVVHRGETEPAGWVPVQHMHVDRHHFSQVKAELAAFDPHAVLDAVALTRQDAELALAAVPEQARLVVLSSVDVYRAYTALLKGVESDPVPLDEESPVRDERYPYRGQDRDLDDYEKLDVEEVYRARSGTVLRLPMVHGAYDRQRREEFILRRVRAGRRRIPFGAGTWLTCRGYVGDIAAGIRLALEHTDVAGEIFNLAERRTASMRLWAEQILHVAGFEADLVRVADGVLPEDMRYTGSVSQHLQADASKARRTLGWQPGEPLEGLRLSVQWHLANPPTTPDPGFEADDRALASVNGTFE